MFIPTRLSRLLLLGCVCGLLGVSAALGTVQASLSNGCEYDQHGYHEAAYQEMGNWFGVKGRNHVRDASVEPGSTTIRSIWVATTSFANPLDFVEIGWCKGRTCCTGDAYPECRDEEGELLPPHLFAAWVRYGWYDEKVFEQDTSPVGTTPKFNVVCRWGTWWKWWVDGQMMHETWNTFNYGPVGGQSEVKNTCDGAYTRWWDLQYFTAWEEWYPWYSLGSYVTTIPGWHLQKLQGDETQFWVVRD